MRTFAVALALFASVSPVLAMDLPNLWFPEEFTGVTAEPVVAEPVVVKR